MPEPRLVRGVALVDALVLIRPTKETLALVDVLALIRPTKGTLASAGALRLSTQRYLIECGVRHAG